MLIYLDQNIWIDLAKISNGLFKGKISNTFLERLKLAIQDQKIVLPLSAIHYMETARIKNASRRKKLGNVMWEFSEGKTLASYKKIVTHESETALAIYFPQVKVADFDLIGFGVIHAFGDLFEFGLPNAIELNFEQSCLTGHSDSLGVMSPFPRTQFAVNFQKHLKDLYLLKKELPPNKWDDALFAISLADIVEEFSKVMFANGISPSKFMSLEKNMVSDLVSSMPSRALQFHLSKQVLKKSDYMPKITDLEDWSGLGIGAQYCDVIICEKHFADMLSRDGFQHKAEVFKKITDLEYFLPS